MPTRPITGPLTRSPSGGVTGVGGGWSPLSISGLQVWYDPADIATQWQDSGTPATAVEQTIGLRLDRSRGLALGPELIANGGFDSGSDWTLGTGWAISGGVASHTGAAGDLTYTSAPLVAGKWYRVQFDRADTAGTINVLFGTNTQGVNPPPGRATVIAQANGTALTFQGGGAYVIDNVSVRELAGNHAAQVNGALRAKYRGRVNLATQSGDISNAAWTKEGATTPSANRVTEGAAAGNHRVYQADAQPNGVYTVTWEVQAGERSRGRVSMSDQATGEAYVDFDLSVPSIASATPGGSWSKPYATMTALGSGRYRISLTATKGAGTNIARMLYLADASGAVSYTGDGVSGMTVYCHQFEAGGYASTYQAITTATSYADTGFRQYDADGVDDTISASFPASLGTACTVVRAVPRAAPSVLTAQTIGTSYADTLDSCGLFIFDRALTAAETANLTTWCRSRSLAPSVTIDNLACWGDSLTAGTGDAAPGGYPRRLGVARLRAHYNGGVGGETSTQIRTRCLADTHDRNAWVNVLWMGRNNFAAPATVKADIAACVAGLAAGNGRYLVVSVLTSSADTAPDIATISTLNEDLSTLYGARYLDVLAYLQSKGDGGANDNTDIAAGLVPRSLRADAVHLNAAGYQHVADHVTAKLATMGW